MYRTFSLTFRICTAFYIGLCDTAQLLANALYSCSVRLVLHLDWSTGSFIALWSCCRAVKPGKTIVSCLASVCL